MFINARMLKLSCFLLFFLNMVNDKSCGQNSLFPSLSLAPPSNDDPCNAVSLAVNTTCNLNTYTTATATATAGQTTPSCGFYTGADVWFSIIVPASGAVQIQSAAGVITDGACAAYTGTCATLMTEIGCDDDDGPGLMPQLTLTGLTPFATIYIRFWEYGGDNNGTFQICVIDLCPGGIAPANDLPCNAEPVQLGVYTLGNTTICATGNNEPLPGSCWINGTINTVWYSVVAASTSMRIRCNPVTLADPQIALYGGVCGPALAELGCNDDGSSCGSVSTFSDLIVTGLVAGATYYISVDGGLDINGADLVGSFNLLAIDGALSLPPVPGQDCGFFQPVCGQSFTVGNPGFTGVGNICDFSGAGICLAAGERASAWYEFSIGANGVLQFNIVPNDWPGAPSLSGTDYDFAVWKTAGAGAVTCANIAAGAVPLRCNFSALGVTGIYGAIPGFSPPAYPGFGGAYDAELNVVAGEKYVLVVSNYSTSTSGFNLNFSGASPVVYGAGAGATVYWSGSVSTDWFNINNWGGCAIPSATINAVINGGVNNQPVINSGATCKSLTINPGATLTIQGSNSLQLFGDYINNGTLNANPVSQILINNNLGVQTLSGNMIGANGFPNLYISKINPSVVLNHDIDIKASLWLQSSTTLLNAGTKKVKVAGDFTVSGTYTHAVPGLLEFNGNINQLYTNNGNVPNVRINSKTTIGLLLQSNLNINSFAKLTLDSGIVRSNGWEVRVFNRNPNALTTGNTLSYVEGSLRRYINTTGSYDFPVGAISKGFQKANINFAYPADPTAIDNLMVYFQTYSSTPGALGTIDCGATFSNPALNNGYWLFNANANAATGKFDLILNNRSYTNNTGSNGWTIMSNNGSGWALANGNCIPSPVTSVKRTGMTGVLNFGTAQSPGILLPVEWLYFIAKTADNSIQLEWATATEDNNDGFEIYRSIDQFNFEKIGWVDGHGNSNVVNIYMHKDITAKPGINYYYKLRQVDFNGNFEESKTITAKLNYQNLTIHPNPVINAATVTFYTDNKNIRLDILRPTGEVVKTLINELLPNENQTYLLEPEKLSLASGCYILRLIEPNAVNHVAFCYIR